MAVRFASWDVAASCRSHRSAESTSRAPQSCRAGARTALWRSRWVRDTPARSSFSLGARFANGEGVAKDDVLAVRSYRLAADKGAPRCQVGVAV